MKSDIQLMRKVSNLTLHSMNGTLNEQGMRELEELLESNPLAVEYYLEVLWTHVGLNTLEGISSLHEVGSTGYNQTFWDEMAEYEKKATTIEPPQKNQRELIQKVVYPPREKRRLSKFNIFMLFNSAAVILFLVILKFAPSEGIEVATLTDSINAKWADVDGTMQMGTRLSTRSDALCLREGMAELLFDNKVNVIIEGPAEFELLAEDLIRLNYGKIYSSVPEEAIGFSIFTQNAKIIDMGTEFGVEADFRGNTQLHVIKGSTMLIAGDQSEKKGITVDKGTAKKISAVSSEISDISCDSDAFVRNIDSKENMVWRGGNLSLASIVAGRDGFQEVGSLTGLDPVKGEITTSISHEWRRPDKSYSLLGNSRFIDGIFVPDGEFGPVQITSMGHTFNCPDTTGVITHEIAAYKGSIKNNQTTIPPVIIKGQEIVDEPILMIHSNTGITFDLQAIRQSLPQLKVDSLKATAMPTTETYYPDLIFWVLVDGQLKYDREIMGTDTDRGPIPFNVEFSPKDRFVTLIVTDGLKATDDKSGKDSSYANDFFYLIRPEICLTESSGN